MTDYKTKLRNKNISISSIAKSLGKDKGLVSKILSDKYNGSEATKKEVIKYVEFLLKDKEDLNPIIYNNADLFIRALTFAMRSSKNFSDDEAQLLIDTILKLKKYKKNFDEQK
jgi:hypothetical protein